MGFLSLGAKRICVCIAAVALVVLAALAISSCPNTTCLVLEAVIIACGVFGFIGAVQMNPRLLGVFLMLLVVLAILQLIYIIVTVVNNGSAHTLVYEIVVLVLLCVTAAFTTDLRWASAGAVLV